MFNHVHIGGPTLGFLHQQLLHPWRWLGCLKMLNSFTKLEFFVWGPVFSQNGKTFKKHIIIFKSHFLVSYLFIFGWKNFGSNLFPIFLCPESITSITVTLVTQKFNAILIDRQFWIIKMLIPVTLNTQNL